LKTISEYTESTVKNVKTFKKYIHLVTLSVSGQIAMGGPLDSLVSGIGGEAIF
jgi:hypothetical protein